jgi:hypothetical protein
VVLVVGVTTWLPLSATDPIPEMLTLVALVDVQFKVDDSPAEMLVGLAKQLVSCTPGEFTTTTTVAVSWLVAFFAVSV